MSEPPRSELEGLNPEDLLARGLHTVHPTGDGRWNPPTAEEVAHLLPQYEVECLLGRGGMGAVYRGLQVALARPVAIKLLPVEMTGDATFVARFQREARTLARMHHSNIVAVYDFGTTADGHLYFVMEYVDGTDLRKVLRGPGLQPEQVLKVVSDICEALSAAHRQGLMHRDIKPENVLLTRDGEVKLADFGLARPVYEDDELLTRSDVAVGTPAYMAPEQHAGQADHRTDIFALGIMFYEMLCGRPPRGVIDPPSQKVQVDVRIDQVVLRALQAEPSRRYQSVVEMKSDVDQIRSSTAQPRVSPTPAPAPPPKAEPVDREPRSVRLRPRRMAIYGLAGAVLMVALWFLFQPLANPPVSGQASHAEATPTSQPVAPPTLLEQLRAATKEHPYRNSLGQDFVPVPGAKVLFCTTPTRVRDFRPFAQEYGAERLFHSEPHDLTIGVTVGGSWDHPNFPQQEDHPVVNVSWYDAKAFCRWLGTREKVSYRLPTDLEWSIAVGIDKLEDPNLRPEEKTDGVKRQEWGDGAPPAHFGNTGDRAMHAKYPKNFGSSNDDGYAETSPVTAFRPTALGLYDMTGNVNQWVEDWSNATRTSKVRRGVNWMVRLWPASHRDNLSPRSAATNSGFRCVIDLAAMDGTGSAVTEARFAQPIDLLDATHMPNWKHVGPGDIKIVEGVATTESAFPWGVSWYMPEPFEDFQIDVEFRAQDDRSASSLFLRYQQPVYPVPNGSQGELLQLSSAEGNAWQPGSFWPQAKSGVDHVPAGEWHRLKVIAIGAGLQVYLDDRLVNEISSTGSRRGYIGIQNPSGAGAQVRNLRIAPRLP